jgi:D-arginine dehydrogenase
MSRTADMLVIGAGMAGASVAAHLAARHRVILLEMEERPGYHTTGRSAALYEPNYGPPAIKALSRASRPWFDHPPDGFVERPVLSPRPTLFIVPRGQEKFEAEFLNHAVDVEHLPVEATMSLVPVLRPDMLLGAYLDSSTADIDVDLLHQAYLRLFRQHQGELVTDAEAFELQRRNGSWRCRSKAGDIEAGIIVNAAGAWGDIIATRAGLRPLGLQPKKRSVALIPAPFGHDLSKWPATADVGETFYFKPTGGVLLVSPADATPVEPHDAFADDMMIAEGIDRLQACSTIEVGHVQRTWAGLRTFTTDGTPAMGRAADDPSFFWLVGQGGYGIQTAPALSVAAAVMIQGDPIPPEISSYDVSAESLSPGRFY